MGFLRDQFASTVLLTFITSLAIAQLSLAQTWTGEGDNIPWDDPMNWSLEGVPQNGDVDIPKESDYVVLSSMSEHPELSSITCKGTLDLSAGYLEVLVEAVGPTHASTQDVVKQLYDFHEDRGAADEASTRRAKRRAIDDG